MRKKLNLLETTIANLDRDSDIPLYSVALKKNPCSLCNQCERNYRNTGQGSGALGKIGVGKKKTKNTIYESSVEYCSFP